MANHLIRRQIFELNIPDPGTAPQLQEQIRTLYWEQIHPAMEQLFSSMAPEDVVIRLDKLEVDLGNISLERIKEAVLTEVQSQVEKKLAKNKAATAGHWSAYRQAIASPGTEETLRLSASQSRLYALVFFLETGILPWWTPTGKDRSPQSLLAAVMDHDPAPLIDLIRRKASPQLERRLGEQFPLQPLVSLWAIAAGFRNDQQLSQWQLECRSLLNATAAARGEGAEGLYPATFSDRLERTIRHSLAKLILHPENNAQGNIDRMTDRILEQAIRNTGQAMDKTLPILQSALKQAKTPTPQITQTLRRLQKKYETASTDFNSQFQDHSDDLDTSLKEHRPEQLPVSSTRKEAHSAGSGKQSNLPTTTSNDEDRFWEGRNRLQTALEEGVFVPNAGLILIVPFLPAFFRQLELVEGKKFRARAEQERALLLTQYLVVLKTEMAEEELLLNKLICGWPPAEPAAGGITLSDRERNECEDLLQSVARHWTALGKTSNEALRETFLRREGKITGQEPQYKLQIERKGVDVLLDRLPWSIGYIKLPWMDHSITVEW